MKNASNKHIICRQVLDMRFPRSAPAFEWQHEMSRYYHQHLQQLLEKACDEICPEGESIQLDTVTIDLGIIRWKELKAGACNEAVYVLLLEQLRQHIPATLGISAKAAGSIRLSIARQWLYYMQHGYLPWNTLKADQVWYQQVLEAFATDYQAVTLLRKLLLQDEQVVLQRIVRDHQQAFLVQLLEILTATRQAEILVILEELALLHASATLSFGEQQQFWQFVIKMAAAAGRDAVLYKPLQLAKVYIQQQLPPVTTISETAIEKLTFLQSFIQEEIIKHRPTTVTKAPVKAFVPANAAEKAVPVIRHNHKTEAGIPQEGIYLINAGVVLLHPFLSTLFKKLGLQFNEPADHEKALFLIHYLATGEKDTPEHALVVPKLLCEWPLGKSLAYETILTADDCAAADELLEAVIEHWDKLQHSSIDGLRGSFLQRNGKVYTHNDQTYIQVEQQALDVLLDYLPWSISHIKLPWMKSILRIEWR